MSQKTISLLHSQGEQEETDESKRLGSNPPLKTLASLSLGPILSEIGSSTYGIVDAIWVGKSLGTQGMSASGSVFALVYLAHGFTFFISVALNSQLGYLHGKKKISEIPNVLLDILRMAIFFGFLVPFILLPSAHSIMKLIGISETNQKNGFLYLLPMVSAFIITSTLQFLSSIFQASGHSLKYGLVQFSINVIDMLLFDPVMLLVFHTQIWGSSLATILAQLCVLIILIVVYRKKNIITIPKDYKWFGKPSPHSYSAFKVGLSALIAQIAMTLPSVVIQKYLSLSSHAIGVSTEVMGVWTIMGRVYHLVEMVTSAMSKSFLPAGSYAFGSKNGTRYLWLVFHIWWIGVSWALICSFAFSFFPDKICKIWTSDTSFSYWLTKMIPPSVYTAPLMPLRAAVTAILQSTKRGHQASLLNFLAQLVALPLFSSILYFTKKDDPIRIVYCYIFSDSTAFILSILFAISPLKQIRSFIHNQNA